MSTFFNAPTQAIGGGGLSSREGKRNRKTQALSALLSASALGLFLEGCGGGSSPSASTPTPTPTITPQIAGFEYNRYVIPEDVNARIVDSDTSGTGMVDATDANRVIFTTVSSTEDAGPAYSSPGQFTFTRSGNNLIVDAASVYYSEASTTSPIRGEIVDYFLRPSAFVFFYNAAEEGRDLVSLEVPSNVPPATSATTPQNLPNERALFLGGSQSGEVLLGAESPDRLEGGGGADTLNGGEGYDIAIYENSDDPVIVDLSAGTGEGGDAEGDTLVGIEGIFGSAYDDTLTGDAEANLLVGRAGADTLEGKGGTDDLNGGLGADTYIFGEGDGADTVVEVAEEGVVNTLRFNGNYEVSDFSYARQGSNAFLTLGGPEGGDLVITVDTDGEGQAENEVTLFFYFVSETSTETTYSIELQINDEEAFVPSVEGIPSL